MLLKNVFPVGKFKLKQQLLLLLTLKVPKVSENLINGQMLGTDFTNNGIKIQATELAVVFEEEVIQTYYVLCNKL